MATRSVKFEISIEKLSVKFEGDIQMAEQMQSQITGAINNLASAQNRLLAPSRPPAASPALEVLPSRRRRKRRKSMDDVDTSILDAEVVSSSVGSDDNSSDSAPARRRTGAAPTALVTALKTEKYFDDRRTLGDVRVALSQKGHTFTSQDINPILVRLTQDGVLKREKNAAKQWVYYAS